MSQYEETKLSVILVNYNVKYFLEQCLYSVRAATVGMDMEIIVVDNHSTDGSVDYLRQSFPEVIFVENQENVGFAKANNQAIRQCRGEYILLLNPDTVVGEECIRSLCFHLDQDARIGAIGVQMINGHGVFLPESKRSFPTPWVSFCKLSGLSGLFPESRVFARYALPYLSRSNKHKVEVLSGAFMLLRHEAIDTIGLLDESFFMYGEDVDLSCRMIAAGYKNLYVPERILHYKGQSSCQNEPARLKAFYEAMLIFHKKYYPRSSGMTRCLIWFGLGLRSSWMRLVGLGCGRKAEKHDRLLVICREGDFEELKKACVERMPGLEYVNLWNLDEERAIDAICRRNQMKGFTDYAFCYPDVRFEQMLLFMDALVNKKANYHIYTKKSGRLVSSGK